MRQIRCSPGPAYDHNFILLQFPVLLSGSVGDFPKRSEMGRICQELGCIIYIFHIQTVMLLKLNLRFILYLQMEVF